MVSKDIIASHIVLLLLLVYIFLVKLLYSNWLLCEDLQFMSLFPWLQIVLYCVTVSMVTDSSVL